MGMAELAMYHIINTEQFEWILYGNQQHALLAVSVEDEGQGVVLKNLYVKNVLGKVRNDFINTCLFQSL